MAFNVNICEKIKFTNYSEVISKEKNRQNYIKNDISAKCDNSKTNQCIEILRNKQNKFLLRLDYIHYNRIFILYNMLVKILL